MHYYKSDLYDVANSLPPEVTGPLQHAQTGVVDKVIDVICAAVGIVDAEDFNGMLSRYTAKEYLYQIFRGEYGGIESAGVNKVDASGQTFMDPLLARSINPWSSKLGPEQLGPEACTTWSGRRTSESRHGICSALTGISNRRRRS